MTTSTTYLPINTPINGEELIFHLRSESIKDTFEMEKKLDLMTQSGSIKAKVLLHPTSQSLVTASASGSVQCEVIGRPFGNLISEHSCQSGSQKLVYPADWRGTIELTMDSGSYKIGGDENFKVLRDIRQKKSDRIIVAVRPKSGTAYEEGCSLIRIRSGSGSVEVRFEGKEVLKDEPASEKQARKPWMAAPVESDEEQQAPPLPTRPAHNFDGPSMDPPPYPPPYHEDEQAQILGRDIKKESRR